MGTFCFAILNPLYSCVRSKKCSYIHTWCYDVLYLLLVQIAVIVISPIFILSSTGLRRSSQYHRTQSHAFGLLTVAEDYQNPYGRRTSHLDYKRYASSSSSELSPSAKEAKLETGFFKPGLVIFDKDGTLVCFHTMWTPWCRSLASRMSEATGKTRQGWLTTSRMT